MPTKKCFPSAESNPSPGSGKVSYEEAMCLLGLVVWAATLAVQEAEEEGIRVQSLPGLSKAFTVSLENMSQNKT